MASGTADRDGRRGAADKQQVDAVEQIPDEVWNAFIEELRQKVREIQASEEARREFVETLLEKVRTDPYPSRQQLDLIEQSLPPEMMADYTRVLIEKVNQEPYPSDDILRRIQGLT